MTKFRGCIHVLCCDLNLYSEVSPPKESFFFCMFHSISVIVASSLPEWQIPQITCSALTFFSHAKYSTGSISSSESLRTIWLNWFWFQKFHYMMSPVHMCLDLYIVVHVYMYNPGRFRRHTLASSYLMCLSSSSRLCRVLKSFIFVLLFRVNSV